MLNPQIPVRRRLRAVGARRATTFWPSWARAHTQHFRNSVKHAERQYIADELQEALAERQAARAAAAVTAVICTASNVTAVATPAPTTSLPPGRGPLYALVRGRKAPQTAA